MSDRDFKGVWIPKSIWLDDRLTAIDKVILAEIDSLDSDENGCFASNEYLAKFCQCSERKVTESVAKLVNAGYIKVLSFDGRKRHLRSSIEKSAMQTSRICEADKQNLLHSNIDNNSFRSIERERYAHTRDDNPYGDGEGERPRTDTVEMYAVNNLSTLGYRAMQELADFIDDLSGDIVRHAIDNALDKGVRNWSYVRAILNSYVENNVKTVADAKTVDESRKKGGAKEGADNQPDYDEDHRPRAVIPDKSQVEVVKDENNPMYPKAYIIRKTGEEIQYERLKDMCPGERERFWDSKGVSWTNGSQQRQ